MSSCSLPSQSTIDTVVEALTTSHGPATCEDAIAVLRAFPDPTVGGTADSPEAQPLAYEAIAEEEERALLGGQAADSLVPHLDGHGDTEPVEVPRGVRAQGAAETAGAEASTPLDADWGLAEDAADDYPATHPLIRSTTDTDDPRETPYSLNTDGSPMYKRDLRVMGPAIHQPLVTLNTRVPAGFKANQGTDYIPFRIVSPDGVEREARYVQSSTSRTRSTHAPSTPAPRFTYGGKPIYPNNDMVLFTEAFEDRARVDRCLDAIHDPSLTAEVHRYRAAAREEERLNQRVDDLIAALGEVAGKSTASRRRLEMANAMERIEDEAGTMVDHELTRKKTRRGRKVGQQPQRTRIRHVLLPALPAPPANFPIPHPGHARRPIACHPIRTELGVQRASSLLPSPSPSHLRRPPPSSPSPALTTAPFERRKGAHMALHPSPSSPLPPVRATLFARKGGARGLLVPSPSPMRPIRVQRTVTPLRSPRRPQPSLPPCPCCSVCAERGHTRARHLLRSLPSPLSVPPICTEGAHKGRPPPPFPSLIDPSLPIRTEGVRTTARHPRSHPFPLGCPALFTRKGGHKGMLPPAPPFPIFAEGRTRARRSLAAPPRSHEKGAREGTWPSSLSLPHSRARDVHAGTPPPAPPFSLGHTAPYARGHAALQPLPFPLATPPRMRGKCKRTPPPAPPLPIRWKGGAHGHASLFAREGVDEAKPSPPSQVSQQGLRAPAFTTPAPHFRAP
ncbi:hypothetical protein EDB85DRAFT_2158605 [Lactarius pseudohatsudake]|nr:hypothetical protein EDB85DRAFT_2158605 [Lactarius pseudohatsudake]